MLKLPAKWKDGIHIMRLENSSDDVKGVLTVLIRNTDGVIGYMQTIKNEDDESEIYKGFLESVPKWASETDEVERIEDGNRKMVPVTDYENSEYIPISDLPGFELYNPA